MRGADMSGLMDLLGMVILFCTAAVAAGWLLSEGLRIIVRQIEEAYRIAHGHCQQCGYNLTGNTSGVCPECGTPAPGQKP